MTQYSFGTIDPTSVSGTVLATMLTNWLPAVHSTHKGNAAPTYAVAGMMWVDDSATPWVLKLYDGSAWQPFGTFNASTHQFTPAGALAPASGGTSTAYTVTNSPAYAALQSNRVYRFTTHAACGASPTVNLDGLGAKALKAFSGGSKAALAANDLPSGYPVAVMYDGTDMVVLNMPSSTLKSYDSGELTITLSGDNVLTHALGSQPKMITMVLRCKTAEGAYSVGDEVYYSTSCAEDQATGFSVIADSTNIRARAGTVAPCVIRKDGSGRIFITTGNWKLIVRAYA